MLSTIFGTAIIGGSIGTIKSGINIFSSINNKECELTKTMAKYDGSKFKHCITHKGITVMNTKPYNPAGLLVLEKTVKKTRYYTVKIHNGEFISVVDDTFMVKEPLSKYQINLQFNGNVNTTEKTIVLLDHNKSIDIYSKNSKMLQKTIIDNYGIDIGLLQGYNNSASFIPVGDKAYVYGYSDAHNNNAEIIGDDLHDVLYKICESDRTIAQCNIMGGILGLIIGAVVLVHR
jgi:hypothetical protein